MRSYVIPVGIFLIGLCLAIYKYAVMPPEPAPAPRQANLEVVDLGAVRSEVPIACPPGLTLWYVTYFRGTHDSSYACGAAHSQFPFLPADVSKFHEGISNVAIISAFPVDTSQASAPASSASQPAKASE